MRALTLAFVGLAACHDFEQGLRDCYAMGACHDAGSSSAGGAATAGGSTAGGATAGGGTAGGATAGGGMAGGATGGGMAGGGAAGGAAGGSPSAWTVRAGPGAIHNLTGIRQLDDGSLWMTNAGDQVFRNNTQQNVGTLGGFLKGLTGSDNHLYTFSTLGYVEHWNGAIWGEVGISNDDWYAAKALPGGLLWLAGENEMAPHLEVARSDNFGASYDFRGNVDAGSARGICVVPSTRDAWIITGTGDVLFWSGDAGSSPVIDSSGHGTLRAIWCDDTDVVIAGWSGRIEQRQLDGGFVTATLTGVTEDLNAIDGLSPADLWVVGTGGVILHGGRGSWARVASPTSQELLAVHALPDGGAWAAGRSGTVLSHP